MTEFILLALLAGAPVPATAEATLPPGATVRLGTLRFRHAGGSAVAFSPNGKLLATDDVKGTIAICDVPSGWLRQRLIGHERSVHDLVFTADNKRVISTGEDWTIRVWDVATGKQVGIFYPGSEERVVWCLAVSPDGKWLASSGEAGKVTLRELPGGKVKARLDGNRFYGHCLQFSPDGKTLAASGAEGGGVRLYDVDPDSGTFGKQFCLLKAPAASFAFTPDGKGIWTLGQDRQVRLWDVSGEPKQAFKEVMHQRVEAVACFAGGRRLACVGLDRSSQARRVVILDAATGKRLHTFAWHAWSSRRLRLAVSPDDRTLAMIDGSPAARLWDGVAGKEIERDPGHYTPPTSLAFTADGRTLASAGADGTVRLWDAVKGTQRRRIDAGAVEVTPLVVAITADGRTLATGGDDPEVRLWEASTGKLLRTLAGHPDGGYFRDGRRYVRSVAFAPDGKRLVSVGRIGDARVWDVASGKLHRTLTGKETALGAAVFTGPRSVALLRSRPGLVDPWRRGSYHDDKERVPVHDVETGKATPLKVRESLGVSLSANGASAAGIVHGKTIEVWDTRTGNRLLEVREPVVAALLSPDGQVLAAVTPKDELRFWDVASGKSLGTRPGCRQTVAMTFRPDGKAVATAHGDSSVLLWEVPR